MPAFIRHMREKAKTSTSASSAIILRSVNTTAPGANAMQSDQDVIYTEQMFADDMVSIQETRTSHTATNIESKASFETGDVERVIV